MTARAVGIVAAMCLALAAFAQLGTADVAAQSLATPRPTPSPPPITRLPPRTVHVLFAGASITYGYYASSTSRTFRADLVRSLTSGSRRPVASMVAQPDARIANALRWHYPRGADITVVQFVTDDFAAPTPLTTFEREYEALLRNLVADSPRTKLVCLSDWMQPWKLNRLHVSSAAYNEAVAAECTALAGTFVDISEFFDLGYTRGPRGRSTPFGRSDGFHPNDEGHRLIASAIYSALTAPVPRPTSHAFLTTAPRTAPSNVLPVERLRLRARPWDNPFAASVPLIPSDVGRRSPLLPTPVALIAALAALAVLLRRVWRGSRAAGS